MAHSLSAKKRIRQNAKRRAINRARKGEVKKQIRSFLEMSRQTTDIATLETKYKAVQKKVDMISAKGTMHRNTAARRKSLLARQLNAAKNRTA